MVLTPYADGLDVAMLTNKLRTPMALMDVTNDERLAVLGDAGIADMETRRAIKTACEAIPPPPSPPHQPVLDFSKGAVRGRCCAWVVWCARGTYFHKLSYDLGLHTTRTSLMLCLFAGAGYLKKLCVWVELMNSMPLADPEFSHARIFAAFGMTAST